MLEALASAIRLAAAHAQLSICKDLGADRLNFRHLRLQYGAPNKAKARFTFQEFIMSVLKKGAAFGAFACVSVVAFAAPAAAQTQVHVKVVVSHQPAQYYAPQPYEAPTQYVHPAPQAYYAPQPVYVQQHPVHSAPCPQAWAHAPEPMHPVHEAPRGVRYNKPRTTIAHVQQIPVPQPYYSGGTQYSVEPHIEPRAHSRWR
jgi:hypothetical protein